jgi:hypothetical protein
MMVGAQVRIVGTSPRKRSLEMATAALRRAIGPRRGFDPELVAFQQFFGTLAANPSVQLIGVDELGGYLDLWVRLGDDDQANESAIYAALSAYHASEGVETPIDVHVVFADEAESAFPAGIQILYRRQR